MATQVEYDRLVEDVEKLTPEQRRRLRALLDTWQGEQGPTMTEEEFEEEMERKGILRRPTGPRGEAGYRRDFEPIQLEGEPLSEQIIRERR